MCLAPIITGQKWCAVMMMSYTKNISIYSLWTTSIDEETDKLTKKTVIVVYNYGKNTYHF